MQLRYLEFDFSDEESGRGSFDAMATVAAARVGAVLDEISLVLIWADRVFGPGADWDGADDRDDGDEWRYDVQAFGGGEALVVVRDSSGKLRIRSAIVHDGLTELTFTLSGSAAFCHAFRQEFGVSE